MQELLRDFILSLSCFFVLQCSLYPILTSAVTHKQLVPSEVDGCDVDAFYFFCDIFVPCRAVPSLRCVVLVVDPGALHWLCHVLSFIRGALSTIFTFLHNKI